MVRTLAAFSLLFLALASCGDEEGDDAVDVFYPAEGYLGLPFSDAVRVGNMLYLSGQIGNRPGTLELVDGGMGAQARQALENIRTVLEAYGSSMDEIVKCTIMLEDMADWPAFNEIYVTYFPGHKPARSALGTSGLALGALVEVECMATVRTDSDDD